jgi:hypothetical protein
MGAKHQVREKFITELHHICPKTLFPEFTKLSISSWNGVHLTHRQHFIAHWLLWKSYPNKSLAYAFWAMQKQRGCYRHHNTAVTSKVYAKLKSAATQFLSDNRKGRKLSDEARERLSVARSTAAQRTENSWRQQQNKPGYDKFTSHEHMTQEVLSAYRNSCNKSPARIADEVGISEYSVKTILRLHNLITTTDPNFTKLVKRYGDKFSSYDDYVAQVVALHNAGLCPENIAGVLGVSPNGIKPAIAKAGVVPHKGVTGPKAGTVYKSKPGSVPGLFIWINNGTVAVKHNSTNPIPEGWCRGRSISF